jgi:serine phosphatase RsbU (regulator of sigma subunit)
MSSLSSLLGKLSREHLQVQRIIFPIAEKFWPGLKDMSGQRRLVGVGEVFGFLYSFPLALLGLVLLILATDVRLALENWTMLLLLGLLMYVFRKLGFFMIAEIRSGRYASFDGSMESMVVWTGLLLLGPIAILLSVFWAALDFVWRWSSQIPLVDRWTRVRNFSLFIAGVTLGSLLALWVYRQLGGEIPLAGLSAGAMLPAFAAMGVYVIFQFFIWSGFTLYAVWIQKNVARDQSVQPLIRFLLVGLGLPNLAHPFGALLVGVYVQNGLFAFLVFIFGLLLVAFLTRRLSWAAEIGRQKSRQLEKLELLSRAILSAPPDASTLPELIREHVPTMFPSGRIAIWVSPYLLFLKHPEEWEFQMEDIWHWIREQTETHYFLANTPLPWKESGAENNALVAAPILDVNSNEPLGGVYLELYSLAQPWDSNSLENLFPAVQSLAAQIASAIHQAEVYSQALAYNRVSQELALAGRIQASFMPAELPSLDGWQLAVTLLPVRETSGDFFDVISLSTGKLGILIADVTDKGVGAALYMALSRTLIRTYAIEFDDDPQPDVIFFAANNRLLSDARADLFVTVFYGILDPETGELTYANAGHNSPYLIREGDGTQPILLNQTGMPIGVEEDTVWRKETVMMEPGDVLVLYTDGVPDTLNEEEEFFGEERLLSTLAACSDISADGFQETIMNEVRTYMGNAPQFDDITLMVLARDAST